MSSTQEVGDIFGEGKGSAQAMLRSPTVLILCVGLWGMNLFFFRLFGIDYKYVLGYDLIEIEKEEKEKQEKANCYYNSNSSSSSSSSSNSNNGYAKENKHKHKHKHKQRQRHISSSSSSSSRRRADNNGYDHDYDYDYTETATTNDLEMMEKSKSKSRSLSPPTTTTTTGTGTGKSSLDTNSQHQQHQHHQVQVPELFSQGPGSSILWYKLVLFSVVLLFLLHFTTHFWMDHLHRGSIGAVGFFYAMMLLYIFLPLQQNQWLRRSFVIVLKRTWALITPRWCSLLCSYSNLCFNNNNNNNNTTTSSTTTTTTTNSAIIIPRRIPFVDVFYADAMCSLSKVFFDWGMLGHQAVHYPHPVPAALHNILIPSMCAALPYLIRARQCLVMYNVGRLTRDPKRYQHLMNAFKYSTSMYPLLLSAYLKTKNTNTDDTSLLEGTLVVLLIINASYSLYWDIVMDWGMMQDPYKIAQTACRMGVVPPSTSTAGGGGGGGGSAITGKVGVIVVDGSSSASSSSSSAASSSASASDAAVKGHYNINMPVVGGPNSSRSGAGVGVGVASSSSCHHLCLRPRLRYGLTLTALIVVADSFLRFSWTLKYLDLVLLLPNNHSFFPSNDAFVLCTQFLEVFRRAIWNLLRVEWENMKQKKSQKLSSLSSSIQNNNNNNNTMMMMMHTHTHDGKALDSLSDVDPLDHHRVGLEELGIGEDNNNNNNNNTNSILTRQPSNVPIMSGNLGVGVDKEDPPSSSLEMMKIF